LFLIASDTNIQIYIYIYICKRELPTHDTITVVSGFCHGALGIAVVDIKYRDPLVISPHPQMILAVARFKTTLKRQQRAAALGSVSTAPVHVPDTAPGALSAPQLPTLLQATPP
jgi:hypothetical protein